MQSDARAASIAFFLGISGVAACALGPLLVQLALIPPLAAFVIFALGLLDGLLALLVGAIGAWQTRPTTSRGGRGRAIVGMGLGAALLAVAAAALGSAGGAPRINDITTDPNDPPAFRAAQVDPANAGRDLGYPGAEFAAAQRAAYPDLEPIPVKGSRDDVYQRALSTAESLGWTITARNPASATFEANETTRIFRFVDDIVVRVRAADGGGSVVDVRSKSRDGKGDLGANAARIRAFRAALGA